jgi:TetR/AcrR family transcriptional regulator, transcriptional repressor for nem operon
LCLKKTINSAVSQDLNRDRKSYGMIDIMRKNTKLRASNKEATHERIVAVASRAIRRSGYDGTGVSDIMKEAGLTHGAFYAHFASREAMLLEAVEHASVQANSSTSRLFAAVASEQTLQTMVHSYLSTEHVNAIESGCPIAALASEMPRQAHAIRSAATRRIKEFVDVVARQMPDWGQPSAHERALATMSTMVGALILARAVDDPMLSEALLSSASKRLTSPSA